MPDGGIPGAFWRRQRGPGTAETRLRAAVFPDFAAEYDHFFLWVPVLFGMGAAVYFGFGPDGVILPVACAAVFAGAAAWAWRLTAIVPFLLVFTVFLAGHAFAGLHTMLRAAPVLEEPTRATTVAGRLVGLEPRADGRTRAIIAVSSIAGLEDEETPVRVRVTSAQPIDAAIGQPVSLRAVLLPPPRASQPGGYNFAFWAYFQGLGAVGFSVTPIAIDKTGPVSAPSFAKRWADFWWRLRWSIAGRIDGVLEDDQGALATALITGLRGGISEETVEALRTAGLAHVLAISGMHMALMAGGAFMAIRTVLALAQALGPSAFGRWPVKQSAAIAAFCVALFYLFLSGGSIATQRAFVMITIVFTAILFSRSAITMRNVALAALLVLLWRPDAVLSASFQMSFAATMALVAGYERARHVFSNAGSPGGLMRHGRGTRTVLLFIGGILLTTVLAGAATAPFAAYHFNRIAPLTVFANLAAMPLVSIVIMPAALLSLALMPLGLEAVPLAVMGIGLEWMMTVAERVSALDGAVAVVPAMPATTLCLFVAAGLAVTLMQRRPILLIGALVAGGFVIWSGAGRPDVLINERGTMVAVRNGEGVFSVMGRRPQRFVLDNWLKRDGDLAGVTGEPARRDGVTCDALGCIAALPHGGLVALSLDQESLIEDCRRARIVVARFISWNLKRAHCENGVTLIEGAALRKAGAHAIYMTEDGPRIITARDPENPRPWDPGTRD